MAKFPIISMSSELYPEFFNWFGIFIMNFVWATRLVNHVLIFSSLLSHSYSTCCLIARSYSYSEPPCTLELYSLFCFGKEAVSLVMFVQHCKMVSPSCLGLLSTIAIKIIITAVSVLFLLSTEVNSSGTVMVQLSLIKSMGFHVQFIPNVKGLNCAQL